MQPLKRNRSHHLHQALAVRARSRSLLLPGVAAPPAGETSPVKTNDTHELSVVASEFVPRLPPPAGELVPPPPPGELVPRLPAAAAVGGAGGARHSASSSATWHTASSAEDCGVEGKTFHTDSIAAHSASRAAVGSCVRHSRNGRVWKYLGNPRAQRLSAEGELRGVI
jgi:hypothetical protein